MFGKPNQAVEKAVLEQEILEREARIAALEAERKAETVSMAAKRLSGHRTKLQKSRRRIANSSRRKNRK